MNKEQLYRLLREQFGHSSFREGQEEIITDVLQKNDVLGILPTGTGKSICYQLPASILPGTTVIISPLVSLMIDQVKQLKASGFKKAVALNSFLGREMRMKVLRNLEKYKLVYLSPEMLQHSFIVDKLSSMDIPLVVIDEAHCISQWGHEFRTDYLKIRRILPHLDDPTVLALSATATPEVQADIRSQLGRSNMIGHIYPMDKRNITFSVEQCRHPEEKINRIVEVLRENHVPSMIYFSSRNWTEKVAFALEEQLEGRKIAYYHGGMDQTDRLLIQQQFMNGELDVICCTSAFGMGINKKDIRMVIHFHLPSQLESYIQEIGRAGRDGHPCLSLLLFTESDYHIPKGLIESELPEKRVLKPLMNRLYVVHEENIPLPSDESMQLELELSESQWRFLKFQLEKVEILQGNKLHYNHQEWQEFISTMSALIDHRMQRKYNRLHELLEWVHHDGCRREKLYSTFQKGFREPTVTCCDYCGFAITREKLFPELETHRSERDHVPWEERLRKVFHQEEFQHES
ncbi:RecQ family ATP-dependent DNA helicase [Thalassobacillus hwangdonensis]|uniref:RecQ family ATP-dependent DNA helicase n=1 Tax=Thalassobacillus hwangdonensis TaxID=546108 RepID=A0ABW3KXB7_9BACI